MHKKRIKLGEWESLKEQDKWWTYWLSRHQQTCHYSGLHLILRETRLIWILISNELLPVVKKCCDNLARNWLSCFMWSVAKGSGRLYSRFVQIFNDFYLSSHSVHANIDYCSWRTKNCRPLLANKGQWTPLKDHVGGVCLLFPFFILSVSLHFKDCG